MDYPGQIQKRGATGPAVRAIQRALGIKVDGDYGPVTEEHVSSFQRAHGITPNGTVGPTTWGLLFKPVAATQDLGERTLAVARKYVGQREQPLGSNRGPFVDQCNEAARVPLGSPWCASFVYYCAREAAHELGVTNPLPRTGSSSALYRWARDNGRLVASPSPGDLFLVIGGDTGHYHTGLASARPVNGRVKTIEGNSNSGGSANGVEVAARSPGRRLASCHFVRL